MSMEDFSLHIFALIPIIQRKSNLLTSVTEFFFWTLRKLLVFAREGSSMARGRSMPSLFSHSPQCRTTSCREGDNKGVGRKRTSGITNASDKAHHVRDTGVKGHGSFTIIVSRSSTFLQLSSPFRLLFSDAFGARPPPPQFSRVQAIYTRGNNKRNGTKRKAREGDKWRKGVVLSTEATSLPLKPWTRFILSSLSESLSNIPSLWPPSRWFLADSLWTCPATSAPASPALTLPSSFNLFSRVACSRPPPCLLSLSPVPCRRYVEYANKSCTNVPEVWTRSPINYSVGAADPPSLFRAVPPFSLSLSSSLLSFSALSSTRTGSRRGSGVKFILQIYSFIYCERLFTPVAPGRITAAEREMYRTPPTVW